MSIGGPLYGFGVGFSEPTLQMPRSRSSGVERTRDFLPLVVALSAVGGAAREQLDALLLSFTLTTLAAAADLGLALLALLLAAVGGDLAERLPPAVARTMTLPRAPLSLTAPASRMVDWLVASTRLRRPCPSSFLPCASAPSTPASSATHASPRRRLRTWTCPATPSAPRKRSLSRSPLAGREIYRKLVRADNAPATTAGALSFRSLEEVRFYFFFFFLHFLAAAEALLPFFFFFLHFFFFFARQASSASSPEDPAAAARTRAA